jgi:hypothetical protein
MDTLRGDKYRFLHVVLMRLTQDISKLIMEQKLRRRLKYRFHVSYSLHTLQFSGTSSDNANAIDLLGSHKDSVVAVEPDIRSSNSERRR